MISAKNISFSVHRKQLLHKFNVFVKDDSFTVIMGPNCAGKSTLLKILAGALLPTTGSVFMNDKLLSDYKTNELAKLRAVLSQHYHLNFPLDVKEIVMMGRYPYFDMQPTVADEVIVNDAMQQMQTERFSDRDYNTLSGGEAQKVQMSRVLAQIGDIKEEKKILFLDEPVSHLDIKYQHQLLTAAKQLCANNVTVIAVLHDINLALNYADEIVFMRDGTIKHILDEPSQISSTIISDVFDVECSVITEPKTQKPIVVF